MGLAPILRAEARDAVVFTSSTLISRIGAFLLLLLYLSRLSPEDFGILAVIAVIGAFQTPHRLALAGPRRDAAVLRMAGVGTAPEPWVHLGLELDRHARGPAHSSSWSCRFSRHSSSRMCHTNPGCPSGSSAIPSPACSSSRPRPSGSNVSRGCSPRTPWEAWLSPVPRAVVRAGPRPRAERLSRHR